MKVGSLGHKVASEMLNISQAVTGETPQWRGTSLQVQDLSFSKTWQCNIWDREACQ